MTLFCANEMEDPDRFRTELKQLLETLSCRQDKNKLYELWQREDFTHLDRETAEAIAVLTDRPLVFRPDEKPPKIHGSRDERPIPT